MPEPRRRVYERLRPFSTWTGVRPSEKGWQSFERFVALTQRATGEQPVKTFEIVARAAADERADRLIVDGETVDQRQQIAASVLQGYGRALAFAARREPMTEDWLRELHAIVCCRQQAQSGPIDWNRRVAALAGGWALPSASRVYPFVAGQYKADVCHPMSRRQRRRHRRYYRRQRVFASAADVSAEMRRFLDDLNSPAFVRAHPAVQSAFAHYGLVAIHPFQDGNGRVARILASAYMLRRQGIPPLIVTQHYPEYIGALRQVDAGAYRPLVDFIVQRCRGAVARWYASALWP